MVFLKRNSSLCRPTRILGIYLLTTCIFSCTPFENPIPPHRVPPPTQPDVVAESDSEPFTLKTLSKGVSSIAKRASGALVLISTSQTVTGHSRNKADPYDFFFGPHGKPELGPKRLEGIGSGFIINLDEGQIITSNHVVEEADDIHVKLANGETYDGKIIGRDNRTDIAVIKIREPGFKRQGLEALRFAATPNLEPGEFVIALGAPFGLETSVSFGVVSAVNRGNLSITELGDFIQTDAAINPGNSGGPLLNIEGEVIGVNAAIYSQSGASNGIGFAVPSQIAQRVASEIIKGGKVNRSYLGVQLEPLTAPLPDHISPGRKEEGALVSQVVADGPAQIAGIRPGDIIVNVNGMRVKNAFDLSNKMGLMVPGSDVKLDIVRNRSLKQFSVRLKKYPDEEERRAARLEELTSGR